MEPSSTSTTTRWSSSATLSSTRMCEHHLLPFFGKAHIAYIPQGKVIGLSKLPGSSMSFARTLAGAGAPHARRSLTQLRKPSHPQGVAVILEAQHLCMMMRGVEKQHSHTTTSAMLGVFKTQTQTRSEFLALIRAS